MKKCCENCRYWDPVYGTGSVTDYDPKRHTGIGECLRYPPQLVYIPKIRDGWPTEVNPETGVLGVCGEFKAMKNPRKP